MRQWRWMLTQITDWHCEFITPHTLERCVEWLKIRQEDPNNETHDQLTISLTTIDQNQQSLLAYKSDRHGSHVIGLLARLEDNRTAVKMRGEMTRRARAAMIAPVVMAVIALVFGMAEGRTAALVLSIIFFSVLPIGWFVQRVKQRQIMATIKRILLENMIVDHDAEAAQQTDVIMEPVEDDTALGGDLSPQPA